jgi:hypothetical protein
MTAKEMFEKLGFRQNGNEETGIMYVRNESEYGYEYVCFLPEMAYECGTLWYEANSTDLYVKTELIKPINQQLKELGWLK